ncbi:hypothetical protein LINPERPRIM_LOCUS13220 [Linum perenne]
MVLVLNGWSAKRILDTYGYNFLLNTLDCEKVCSEKLRMEMAISLSRVTEKTPKYSSILEKL